MDLSFLSLWICDLKIYFELHYPLLVIWLKSSIGLLSCIIEPISYKYNQRNVELILYKLCERISVIESKSIYGAAVERTHPPVYT